MNKTQLKTFIATPLQVLRSTNTAINADYWARAHAAVTIKEMIVWDNSPYKTFSKFIAEELPGVSLNAVNTWMSNYRRMRKWNYSLSEIQTIAAKVGYNRITEFAMYGGMKRKISPASFIKKALAYKSKFASTAVHNPNLIMLHFNKAYQDKLNLVLLQFGYTPQPNGRRDGISRAVCRLLDTL